MSEVCQVKRDAMLVRDFSAKLTGANIHRGRGSGHADGQRRLDEHADEQRSGGPNAVVTEVW